MRHAFSLCTILVLAALASASRATAGEYERAPINWWHAHHAIYHMENFIAFLEANPNADESYKGPAIEATHVRIRQWRAAIGPRWPHWPTPCCYSRKPIYIR